jgi:hypothetical protein
MLTAFFMLLSVTLSSECMAASTQTQVSLGMSETMGPFGAFNISKSRFTGRSELFVVAGSTAIIFGGVGAGWKYRFRSWGAVPYISATGSGIYMLPAMCQSCDTVPTYLFAVGAVGLELPLFQLQQTKVSGDLGVMSIFNVTNWEMSDSPSDRPGIWPAFNLKFKRAQ